MAKMAVSRFDCMPLTVLATCPTHLCSTPSIEPDLNQELGALESEKRTLFVTVPQINIVIRDIHGFWSFNPLLV
jgi:hypothetical protein